MNYILIVLFVICLTACNKESNNYGPAADDQGHSKPTSTTADINSQVSEELNIDDQKDFEDANRGLIDTDSDLKVTDSSGEVIWDQNGFDFIKGPAPASANPSLWRQAKLNNIHGLFKVTEGVFQLRGYDLANISIIEGDTGIILVDPLTSKQTAQKAMSMISKHFKDKPIKAIIFTHSHMDHFGGALGIKTQEDIVSQGIRVIAPKGFLEEATSENIIAGPAMARRSMYMYGKRLARSERGHIGSGLGKHPAYGSFGILQPTELIEKTGVEKRIDGVDFIFQYAPDSEAPAELTFYLPEKKAFCGAELVSKTMHNLYTLRGTKVRDALLWSHYINQALVLFGTAEVYFGSHHWPTWGNQEIKTFLIEQRDTYKYIHDQTVRLLNKGLTPNEIAEQIELPESLQKSFSNRGYYGTLKHNAKAVYQYYLGWYDGIPSNLDPLPIEQSSVKYVLAMGGDIEVMKKAQTSYEAGDYRWVAELLKHLVFAQPNHYQAKELLAKTYDQLGYQSESAPWRDVYLSGAYELRHEAPEKGIDMAQLRSILEQTPVSFFFDSMSVRLMSEDTQGDERTVKIYFTDLKEAHELKVINSVLHHKLTTLESPADATLKVTKNKYIEMLLGEAGLTDILFSSDIQVDGSTVDLLSFFKLFEKPKAIFNIVTP